MTDLKKQFYAPLSLAFLAAWITAATFLYVTNWPVLTVLPILATIYCLSLLAAFSLYDTRQKKWSVFSWKVFYSLLLLNIAAYGSAFAIGLFSFLFMGVVKLLLTIQNYEGIIGLISAVVLIGFVGMKGVMYFFEDFIDTSSHFVRAVKYSTVLNILMLCLFWEAFIVYDKDIILSEQAIKLLSALSLFFLIPTVSLAILLRNHGLPRLSDKYIKAQEVAAA